MQPELPDMIPMLVIVNFFYTAKIGANGERPPPSLKPCRIPVCIWN
jgi:hypothetical protein